jgi:hypothetical protein
MKEASVQAEATTAKAVRETQSRHRLCYALDRLLHNLRPFVRAYLMHPGEELPEHRLVWITEMARGPESTILDAIKASPEMWRDAVPAECCIVPRDMLQRVVGDDTICEALEHHGAHLVANQAARLLYEAEERERADWRKSTT